MKWIMVANSNDCRIYEYDQKHHHLALIGEIAHPENKLKVHSLTTDGPGHYKSRGFHRGSYMPEMSPVDILVDDFAREMAKRLDKGRTHHEFEEVALLMPPKMDGLLSKHMNKETKACVHCRVKKNITHLTQHELCEYVNQLFAKPAQWH